MYNVFVPLHLQKILISIVLNLLLMTPRNEKLPTQTEANKDVKFHMAYVASQSKVRYKM